MVNIDLLKDKMKETGMPVSTICKRAGILRQTFYNRYKAPDDFTIAEIGKLQNTLNLTDQDVANIFFAKTVNLK